MFGTFDDRLKKLEEEITKSENSLRARLPRLSVFLSFLFFLFLSFFIGVRATDRRPDAVSTLLICPDCIELYGVQQLSGAVAPLEEKQKR